jgi:glycosyltransferase involved in cell wall biosynthesis
MDPPFNISWLSVAILAPPFIANGRLHRGAIILNYVDEVVLLLPDIRRLFFVIERRGWHGINRSATADIKMVEDLSTLEKTHRQFPEAILLDIGPADFVDHEAFRPLPGSPDFDVIHISCWSPRKRIELLIRAAARLPSLRFLHLGHYERQGNQAEHAYRLDCLKLARDIAPNVFFPFGSALTNNDVPTGKETVNIWLNRAKIGLLTTMPEGINRFKMECIAANRPVLVPSDAGTPTQKHINWITGVLYGPSDSQLSSAIEETIRNLGQFSPREYLLNHSGRQISLAKLKRALGELCNRTGCPYCYDNISWDGRNESLVWGQNGLAVIERSISTFGSLARAVHPG